MTFKFGIKLKSRIGVAAVEELDSPEVAPETPAADAPVEGGDANAVASTDGAATGTDESGAPADGAAVDPAADPAAATDPAAADAGTPPADGTDPSLDAGAEVPSTDEVPVEGAEVPPPVEGSADNGNEQVEALPEAPTIDSNAPADGGEAATPPDVPAEGAGGEVDPAVDAVTPSTDETAIGEEIQENVGELAQIEVAVDETQEDLGTLDVAMEHLRDVVASCEDSLERGGLNREATRHMVGRMALVTTMLGEERLHTAGLEDAATAGDRIFQTQQVGNQAKSLLSRAGDQVSKGVNDLKQWAQQVYAVMTDASMRVEKRALALKARAASSGQAVQVTDPVVIAGVTLGDAVPTDMARAVGELVKTMQFLNASANYAKLEEAMDILQAMANDPTKKSALDAKYAAAFAGYSNKMIGSTAGVLVGGSNGTSKSKLFGEKELVTVIPTSAGSIASTKSSLVDAKAANVPQSINGLDPKIAVRVCDAVVAAARQLREFNKSGATHRLTERVSSVMKSAEDAYNAAGNNDSDQQHEAADQIVSMAQDLAKATAQVPAHAFNRSMITSLNAILDFVADSAGAAAPADGAVAPGAAPAQGV